jgi:SAM-dependent methyltransferase
LVTQFYNDNASELAQQYLSKSFEEVHQSWSACLPAIINNAKYLAQLAEQQHGANNQIQVIAVEPANLLAQLGELQTRHLNVTWLEDSLPALSKVAKQEISFDLILLSAVWMHIPPCDRARSIRKLANCLKPGGQLVISLRHGQNQAEFTQRNMHLVCADELKQLATERSRHIRSKSCHVANACISDA